MQAYNQVHGDARGGGRRQRAVRLRPLAYLADPAYEAELPAPGNDPRNALPHIAFTVPYNMSEQPAASVNWSYSAEGLPIGVQVVGQRFDDAGVLRLPRLIEQAAPAAATSISDVDDPRAHAAAKFDTF